MNRMSYLMSALVALAIAGPIQAQETTGADIEHELRTMVTEATTAEQDRAAVESFLERTDVQDAARSLGLDVEQMKQGVATMDSDAAATLAERVETTENQMDLVGGDTFVISTTAIIIGLLIAILIVVA